MIPSLKIHSSSRFQDFHGISLDFYLDFSGFLNGIDDGTVQSVPSADKHGRVEPARHLALQISRELCGKNWWLLGGHGANIQPLIQVRHGRHTVNIYIYI